MKILRNNLIAFICILLIAFSFSGCGEVDEILDGAISECDAEENQMATEERRFVVIAEVYIENTGIPIISQDVEIQIYKRYCEGGTNGLAEYAGKTNDDGKYTMNGWRGYNYNNKKDVVEVNVRCMGVTKNFIYPWHHVDDWGTGNHEVTCILEVNPLQ